MYILYLNFTTIPNEYVCFKFGTNDIYILIDTTRYVIVCLKPQLTLQSSLKLEYFHLTVGWPKYRTLPNTFTIFFIDSINICTVQFKLVKTFQASTYAIRPCRLINQVKHLNFIHYLKSVLRVNIICHVHLVSTRIPF